MSAETDLRYPVGRFSFPKNIEEDHLKGWIDVIRQFPQLLRELVEPLSKEQLEWAYRPGGWNIQQVVHHLADSHMNSFIRYKLSLTEDNPVIKPYFEAKWAILADANHPSIEHSISILEGIHYRWCLLMESMTTDEWKREFTHPEHGRKLSLDRNLALYAWHCDHHIAHIHQALKSGGAYND